VNGCPVVESTPEIKAGFALSVVDGHGVDWIHVLPLALQEYPEACSVAVPGLAA
jgi:hypothetical protein